MRTRFRMARLYTGRDKALSALSFGHGNTGSAIAANGDWLGAEMSSPAAMFHFFNPYLYRSEFNAATEEEEASARWRICGGSLNARADGHRGDPAGVHPRHRRDPCRRAGWHAGACAPCRRVLAMC